jgi:cytoskeletal protein CcmA (bactofilin family)
MTSTRLRMIALLAVMFAALSVGAVLADGSHETKFTGVIESLPGTAGFIGDWKVSGKTVHVTSATQIQQDDGKVAVGATVKVEGATRTDGSIDARQVEVKEAASGGDDGGSGSGDGSDDSSDLEFTGQIDSLPSTAGFIGDWKVSGRTVHVTSSTRIEQEHGAVAVGAMVRVEGTKRADDSVDAEEIEVNGAQSGPGEDPDPEMKLTGTIESLPGTAGFIGDWKVSGKTVHVTASTHIETHDGAVALGAMVEAEGLLRTDGSLDARQIEVKDNVSELKGTIELLPGTTGFIGDWKVSGKTVHVSSTTTLDREHGAIALGAMVEVKGTMRADGSIDATRIEVKSSSSSSGPGDSVEGESAKVKGAIESLPAASSIGDWTISGKLVHVVSSTKLNDEHGAFAIGTRVKVKGIRMSDGSVVATKIQSRD